MLSTAGFEDFPPLETERLILRQLTLEDADFIFRHFSDSAVTQYRWMSRR
jgi:ribosomal-protein-alanine N-acetyltransferase